MRIDVLTLFPESFSSVLHSSILGRAIESGALEVTLNDFRAYTDNRHKKVDDYAYGGFAGMVIQPEPVYSALLDLLQSGYAPVIYFTPQGRRLDQPILAYYSGLPRVILLCGHYKEMDQRVRDLAVCDEISLGDYVLSGGEIPALAFIDGVTRLLPGVLGDISSAETDSFAEAADGLGFPCYTRPPNWMQISIPQILTTGDHKRIQQWARERSTALTVTRRPDLKSNK